MLIRLSRYVILGMIISLVVFLVAKNNKEKIKNETIILIGIISSVIIFAISFRVEFYENSKPAEAAVAEVGEEQKPIIPQKKSKTIEGSESTMTEAGVDISDKKRVRKMAIEMIEKIDIPGTKDDKELMMKVEKMIRQEMELKNQKQTKEEEKVIDTVTNPKQDGELIVQKQPKENRLSMQYEGAIEDVIKEKIREQLYSDEVVKRRKESDYVIMPVDSWSLPLERRQFKCIPKEEEELKQPCNCGPGEGTGFWGGSFLKIRGAKDLPPEPKHKIELI